MYFIFHLNKCIVQFQLIDYLWPSTDFIIGFTAKLPISFKKLAKKQDAQNTTAVYVKMSGRTYIQKQLADYIPESLKKLTGNASRVKSPRTKMIKHQRRRHTPIIAVKIHGKTYIQKTLLDYKLDYPKSLTGDGVEDKPQDLPPRALEKHGFNSISLDSHKNETPSNIEKDPFDIFEDDYEGMYHSQSYYGRQLPFTAWVKEKGAIHSRYTPGLLHENYLADFEVFHHLEALGVKKSGGFPVKIIFLVLYYSYFVLAQSLERFIFINSEEFSVLINNLAKPKPDTIRKFLKQTITLETALKFSNLMYYLINQLDSQIGFATYIDEHFVIYQGTKKMAKGKSGGKNKVMKGFYRFYLTCARFSIPIFNLPKDGRKRLEKVIFEVLETYQEIAKKKVRLIIFDRGIKSFKTLKKLHKAHYRFICWSFPYKTIEQALKRRHQLKLAKSSTLVKDLIQRRENVLPNGSLTRSAAEWNSFFAQMLPTAELKVQLQQLEQKENGRQKWTSRDFVRLQDIRIAFAEYGVIRTLLLEKKSGERIAIFTDIPAELAHPIEILMVLKKKQQIENFFAYKRAIQGDYIPFWDLQESALQKTKFDHELKRPSPEQRHKFATRIQRIKNALKRISQEIRTWKNRFQTGEITKQRLKKLETEFTPRVATKKAELQEIRAFLRWGATKKRPPYFDQFEPIMELNPRIELFLNAINDLFFVNSRRIASDLGNSLQIAKSQGEFTLSDKKIQAISHFTPEKLNDVLIKGGGKVLMNPNNPGEIIAELHTELVYKDEILIAPYLKMLNQVIHDHKFGFDTRYSIKFSNNFLDIPKPVKMV